MSGICVQGPQDSQVVKNTYIRTVETIPIDMKDVLKYYMDFPIPGVRFVDIFPLLQSRETFAELNGMLAKAVTAPTVLVPEARAFLFVSPLLMSDCPVTRVVPLRKKGKLPFSEGDLVEIRIVKEYGEDSLFYRRSDILAGDRDGDTIYVTILDDVLATGGTAEGVARSLEKMTLEENGRTYHVKVREFVFVVGLGSLQGASRLEQIAPVRTLINI